MNIIVAVPLDEAIAAYIGKKGSTNSITFFNRRSGDDVIVCLLPSQGEEKVYALAESLLLSSQILLSTSQINSKFGEALVASSLLEKKLMLTDENDVGNLLKNAEISNYKVVSREALLEEIISGAARANEQSPVRVDIDHAFPVKGIGTVALGIVTRGIIKQHDKLFHTSGEEVLVRSLQSQDEDVSSAGIGTRIGVSLKDISDEQIRKGDLLTTKPVPRYGSIRIEYKTSKIANEKISEGKNYGVALNFSYSECIVKKAEGGMLELELKTKLPAELGDKLLLVRKEVPRIFGSGVVKAVSE